MATGYTSLEFRREVWAGDENSRNINIKMMFKAMRLDEITQKVSIFFKKAQMELWHIPDAFLIVGSGSLLWVPTH